MKLYLTILFLFILIPQSYSFDLCPACSPETVGSKTNLPGYMLGKNRFSSIALYRFGEKPTAGHKEPTAGHDDFERALISFNYGVTDRFKAGLMYGYNSKKVSLQVDYLLFKERNWMPSLILGAGSFRGILSESHPYLISMKNLESHIKVPARISAGIKHKGDDLSKLQLEPVGNLIFKVHRLVHIMGIFEGEKFDIAMYGVLFDRFIVGMRMIELKDPAMGVVWRR